MNARAHSPFLREHAAPLAGSAALHALAAAALLASAWFTVAPKVTPPAAIEGYLVGLPRPPPPAAQAVAVAPAVATPAPARDPPPRAREPEPVAPAVRPEPDAAQLAAKRALQAAARERADEAARASAAKGEARRQAAAAAKQQQQQALLARRQAEAEAAQRLAEAALARRQAVADATQRSAREADLARHLAVEQQRLGAENAGLLNRYAVEIQARIERVWNRPPSAHAGLRCLVDVVQVPGGTVTGVRIGECNGDAAVQESIKVAVFRSSPLPSPPDPSLFERNLRLVFAPDG